MELDLGEIKKLRVSPEEILVIRYADEKSDSFLEGVLKQFHNLLPKVKVLVLSGVAEIALIPEVNEERIKRGRKPSK